MPTFKYRGQPLDIEVAIRRAKFIANPAIPIDQRRQRIEELRSNTTLRHTRLYQFIGEMVYAYAQANIITNRIKREDEALQRCIAIYKHRSPIIERTNEENDQTQ